MKTESIIPLPKTITLPIIGFDGRDYVCHPEKGVCEVIDGFIYPIDITVNYPVDIVIVDNNRFYNEVAPVSQEAWNKLSI